MADSAELTRDRFLRGSARGALWLHQPRRGYRAGVDPVLLAASVPAKPGQSLLDLGCGVGTAALCAGWRVPGLHLTGLERQEDHAVLAARNAAENGLEMEVVTGDLSLMPAVLRQRQFDHVIANPPYFRRDASTRAAVPAREAAMGEETPMEAWVAAAARRCAPGGSVTFIQRVERLPEILAGFTAHLGSVELKPLVPRAGRESQLFLIRGRKNGRAAFRLHAGLVLHSGAQHGQDRPDYSDLAEAILKTGAILPFDSGSAKDPVG